MNWLQRLLGRNSNRQNTDGTDPASGHTLERQLSELSTLGLSLNEGVSIDDLLYSFKREEYEERPYDLILFVLGIEVEREPWDRCVSSQAWNFDHECITNTGDYTKIAKRLCQIAGNPSVLTNIHDHFDRENDIAWIEYTADGVKRHLNSNSQAPRPKRVTSELPLELRDDFVWGLAQGVEDVEPVFSGR